MSSSLFHTVAQVALVLMLTVGLILLLGWLAKRTQGFGLQGGKHFRILQSLPLGQKEKAVLIELDGNKILLGVTTTQVTHLWIGPVISQSTPDAAPTLTDVRNETADFSHYLKKILSRDLP